MEWLKSTTALDVFKGSVGDNFKLITVKETDSIAHTLETFSQANISSAPVMSATNAGELAGLVDVLDILTFTSAKYGIAYPTAASAKQSLDKFQESVGNILNISGRDRPRTATTTMPVPDLLKLLSLPNTHRVLLLDESQRVVGLVTQSMANRFLVKNKEKLPAELWEKKAIDLFSPARVICMHLNKFVVDALLLLDERQVSGLAVVNDRGQIVANFSAGDLKHMDLEKPTNIAYDVYSHLGDFLKIDTSIPTTTATGLTNTRPDTTSRLPHSEPIVVMPQTSLYDVMSTMSSQGIHRVYMVNEDKIPCRAITLGDVLSVFASVAVASH